MSGPVWCMGGERSVRTIIREVRCPEACRRIIESGHRGPPTRPAILRAIRRSGDAPRPPHW